MARVKCPRWTCGSTDCTPLTEKKKYSLVKGAVGATAGAFLFAPLAIVGAAAGLNGKKTVKMMCNKCGKIFTVKL